MKKVRIQGIVEYLEEIKKLTKGNGYCQLRLTKPEVTAIVERLQQTKVTERSP